MVPLDYSKSPLKESVFGFEAGFLKKDKHTATRDFLKRGLRRPFQVWVHHGFPRTRALGQEALLKKQKNQNQELRQRVGGRGRPQRLAWQHLVMFTVALSSLLQTNGPVSPSHNGQFSGKRATPASDTFAQRRSL